MNQKNLVIARTFLDPTVIHFVQVLVISGIALVPGIALETSGASRITPPSRKPKKTALKALKKVNSGP